MGNPYSEWARRYRRQYVHGIITREEYEAALDRLDLAFLGRSWDE